MAYFRLQSHHKRETEIDCVMQPKLFPTIPFFLLALKTTAGFITVRKRIVNTMKLTETGSEVNEKSSTLDGIKAVIFDIDGTLSDSSKLGFDSTMSVLTANDIPPISEEEYHRCTKYCTPERLARHAGLKPSDPDFESVGRKLGKDFDDLYIGLVSADTAGFYPGISEMIRDLPDNLPLGALTNACVEYAQRVLEVNLRDDKDLKFKSIRGADNVPAPKPSPEGLWLVCKELGVNPEDCVYVGDSPSDGMAAKNAGMQAIAVLWGSHSEESLRDAPFDHFCYTIDELKRLLPVSSNVVPG